MSTWELKKLSRLIFEMARREVWLGGRSNWKGSKDPWPKELDKPNWRSNVTWTLSPEVKLGGHRLRVCVSWTGQDAHGVRVFVDDKLKYPGGYYEQWDWWFWETWSGRIASIERRDGGTTGPVDSRDLLIEEAEQKLYGIIRVEKREEPRLKKEPTPEEVDAVREVSDYLRKIKY